MNSPSLIRHPSTSQAMRVRCRTVAIALVALALVIGTADCLAGVNAGRDGRANADEQHRRFAPVLPPQARPFGYSLDEMARLIAPFNISDRSAPPPNSPFQILFEGGPMPSFDVKRGTYLYVPLLYNDNSAPILGHFPANAENRQKALRYWYSQNEFGVTTMEIIVDGKTTSLGAGYVSGVSFTSPLDDGATQYLTAAAFIAPLALGVHTVEIHFKATGDALREPPFNEFFLDGIYEFSIVYSVTVH